MCDMLLSAFSLLCVDISRHGDNVSCFPTFVFQTVRRTFSAALRSAAAASGCCDERRPACYQSASASCLGLHRKPAPAEIRPFFKSGQIRPRPDLVAGFMAGFTHSFLSAQAERVLTATGRKFSFCKMVLIVLPTLPIKCSFVDYREASN
jgi:hypothetical protein